MLRFEWTAYVTPGVIARLAADTGVAEDAVAELRPLLAGILGHVGGLPFVRSEPSGEERTARGLALLAEAASHTLADAGAGHAPAGFIAAKQKDGRYKQHVTARARVNVNSANAEEFAALPGITQALAGAIVAERRNGGRFLNLEDLERRIEGIGPVRARALAQALVFDGAAESQRLTLDPRGDLGSNLITLMDLQPDADRVPALRRALEMMLTSCATAPHPASREGWVRDPSPAAPPAGHQADWVGELWGDEYWKTLPGLFDGAARSIDVCMFHIAAPNEEHPTFKLIDALRRAHNRGIQVRVLMDRDNKNDPYNSTIINSDARRFFRDAGVPCRSDSSNRLLHSKYLIIDGELVVLGSHNWSAGSYFGFDDLTLAIASPDLAAQLGGRFDTQWQHGN